MKSSVYGKLILVIFLLVTSIPALAVSERVNTDWFLKSGYGVFVHYLEGIQNNADQLHSLGKHTSWEECVRDFDTERFAADVEASGAGMPFYRDANFPFHDRAQRHV